MAVVNASNDNGAPAEGGHSVDDVALRIETGLFSAPKRKAEKPAAPAEVEPENEEATDTADEEQDETEEQEEQDSSDDGEPDDSADPDEDEGDESDAEDETPAPKLHKVKVDGEEVEVPYEELVAGYSRTAAFTRKTMAFADQRRQYEAQVAATQQEYARRLAALDEALQAAVPEEPDWEALREQDPIAFAEEWGAWDKHKQRMDALRAEKAKAEAQVAENNKRALVGRLQAESEALLAAIPEWKDEEKAKAGKTALWEYALQQGFTPEELAQTTDHRAMVALRKAMLYDEAQKNRPAVKKQIEKVKSATPGNPAQSQSSRKSRAAKAKRQALRQTGSEDAAAALIFDLLPD